MEITISKITFLILKSKLYNTQKYELWNEKGIFWRLHSTRRRISARGAWRRVPSRRRISTRRRICARRRIPSRRRISAISTRRRITTWRNTPRRIPRRSTTARRRS
jgi:hypothetical protein